MKNLLFTALVLSACGGDVLHEEIDEPSFDDAVLRDQADSWDIVVLPSKGTSSKESKSSKSCPNVGESNDPNCLDYDDDGVCNEDDNCVFTFNTGQRDHDCDGIGDACDWHKHAAGNETDSCDLGGSRTTGDLCWRHFDNRIVEQHGPGQCRKRCQFMESDCQPRAGHEKSPVGICRERKD